MIAKMHNIVSNLRFAPYAIKLIIAIIILLSPLSHSLIKGKNLSNDSTFAHSDSSQIIYC